MLAYLDQTYFSSWTRPEFTCRQGEYNTGDRARPTLALKARIKSLRYKYHQYNLSRSYRFASRDRKRGSWLFEYHNETLDGALAIPRPMMASDSTPRRHMSTMAYYSHRMPAHACGDRRMFVYSYRIHGAVTNGPNTKFRCELTVGEVSDTSQDAHTVSADSARLAASSTALRGRYTHPNHNDHMEWQISPLGASYSLFDQSCGNACA